MCYYYHYHYHRLDINFEVQRAAVRLHQVGAADLTTKYVYINM